jgi:hypothetical protein
LLIVAGMVAGAQQQNSLAPGAHAAFHAPGVQVPDSFVSQPGGVVMAPGRAVITPGQSIFTPGRTVFTPGQSVFPPGQQVFPSGNQIFPAPHVLTPFHSTSGAAADARRGWRPGRHHDQDHDRYHYRHSEGEGYAVPYLFGSGYWLAPGEWASPDDVGEDQNATGAAPSQPESSSSAAQPPVSEPPASDVYRPAYHAPASAPNVVQSQEPALTVVMKNGATKKVRNYALTPTTLIDLDAAATGREVSIPLEQVNVTATQKAAARKGLSFSVPKG